MNKKKVSSYNDGIVGVYVENSTLINTDFNVKRNARTIENYDFIMNLFYSEVNARDEDFVFAESMGKKLTMKIKTPLVAGVKSNHKIILNDYVYDIIKIDPDRRNKDLYIYLEGGRKLEKQN